MPLSAGTKLGPYEILAAIGAGGMGEVYRGRDTKLKRDVALKVLPEAFAHDSDRMIRFQREAEVLASLNHPNIAGIYGVTESGDARVLVMELVDGETLPVGLPLDNALRYAKQIAEALEYAHERGVIHRDLKPANVKVTSEGAVKLLDFGLAKAIEDPSTTSADPANSPTLTLGATRAGVILGTAAYMSPEQASGRPADRRADIWSFGAVLYEMLSGKREFAGESVADTLATVLKVDPDWDALPVETPASIRRLTRRCLTKDRKQRLQAIGEATIAVEEVISGKVEEAAPTAATSPSRLGITGWIAAGALAIIVTAIWAPWRVSRSVERPLMRLDIDLGPDVSFPAPTTGSSVSISPDGTRLAYTSGTPAKLFTRRLDQPTATELPGTQGATGPFFSPDGQWVGFVARKKLNKISVEGGAVVPLADIANATFAGASWFEESSILVSEYYTRGLRRIPAGGGAPETIAGLGSGERALALPQILPGGKAILFSAHTLPDVDKFTIEVLTLADNHRKIVARGGQSPRYLPTSGGAGHLIYVNKATLFAIPFDLDKLETSRKEPLWDQPGVYNYVSLSPDGKRAALVITEGGNQDVWVYDPQRDARTRLTSGGAVYSYPKWTPDAQYVVFGSHGNGIFQARADGASQPQALTQGKTAQFPWSFTLDGKRLAYNDLGVGNWQVWTVPLEDQGGQLKAGKQEQLKSSFSDVNPSFSPDGRWLAYESNESGKYEVYVRAFPPPSSGHGGKWQISNSGGAWPRWSRNGHELVFRSPDKSGDKIMASSYTVRGDTFVSDKPRVWIAKLAGGAWDLAPDGKRVAVLTPVDSADGPKQEHEVVFLENFFDELRRRVPVRK